MIKSELKFKENEFVKSSYELHNIKGKLNKTKQEAKIVIPFNDLKKENLTLSEDKKYYLLYIKPSFKDPANPDITYELDFKLAIKRETIDKEKLPIEEIVRRAFIEGDRFRSNYNPNYDGRLRGVYYGGTF
ncbi:hypothetical protein [Psychrobacillus sp. FJAT-21963]|uniref:hypothetical protein n=1 Tax=Psychrobacillus sp. FJAT-21963 TaxID=1712028 RepID=UPI0006F6724D|nr:hypothetical protein [Psychrobacillus sp. FJAT-21963]KQL33352.1 hypothetical protein AN959_17485 [Psychrobacillus sp. FJAT-21963]